MKQIQLTIKQNKDLIWKHALTKAEKKNYFTKSKILKIQNNKKENDSIEINSQNLTMNSPQRGRSPLYRAIEGGFFVTEKLSSNSNSPNGHENQIKSLKASIKEISFETLDISRNNRSSINTDHHLKKSFEEKHKDDFTKTQAIPKIKDQDFSKFPLIDKIKNSANEKRNEIANLNINSKLINMFSPSNETVTNTFEKIFHHHHNGNNSVKHVNKLHANSLETSKIHEDSDPHEVSFGILIFWFT